MNVPQLKFFSSLRMSQERFLLWRIKGTKDSQLPKFSASWNTGLAFRIWLLPFVEEFCSRGWKDFWSRWSNRLAWDCALFLCGCCLRPSSTSSGSQLKQERPLEPTPLHCPQYCCETSNFRRAARASCAPISDRPCCLSLFCNSCQNPCYTDQKLKGQADWLQDQFTKSNTHFCFSHICWPP